MMCLQGKSELTILDMREMSCYFFLEYPFGSEIQTLIDRFMEVNVKPKIVRKPMVFDMLTTQSIIPNTAMAKDLDFVFAGRHRLRRFINTIGKHSEEQPEKWMFSIVDEREKGPEYFQRIELNKQVAKLNEIKNMRDSLN